MKGFPLATAVLAVVSAPALAAPLGFTSDNFNQLHSVDFATGSTTLIGSFGISGALVEALALSPGGTLYATDSGGAVYSVNTTTGVATLIGNTGRGNVEGLDFSGDTLIGITFQSTPALFSINTATGAATAIVTATTALPGTPASLAAENATTVLVPSGSGGTQALYAIDLTTGAVTLRGALPGFLAGLDFAADGNLYGLQVDPGTASFLYRINPQTGAGTLVGETPAVFWLGLAAAEGTNVPEPASLTLIGGGLALGMVQARRRRRRDA